MSSHNRQLDQRALATMLPHGPRFRLLHGVTALECERIVAYRQIAPDDPLLRDHFPGYPVMPGVLLVEALAQAAAVLAAERGDYDREREALYLMTIESAKFREPVKPPCRLDLEVVPTRTGKLWKADGLGKVGERVVVEATFIAAIRDWPQDRIAQRHSGRPNEE